MLQNLRCAGRLDALGADVVLDGARDAFEESDLLPFGNLLIDGLGLSHGFVAGNGQVGLYIALDLIDALEDVFGQLCARYFFIDQHVMEDMGRLFI